MHTAVVMFSPARVLSLSLLQRTDKHNHGRNEQPRLHKQPRILDRLSGALAAPWAVLHAPVFLVFPLAPPALFQVPTSTRNRAVGLEPPIGGQNGHSFTKCARKPRSKASCLSKNNRVGIVKSGDTDRDEHPRLANTRPPGRSVRLLPLGVGSSTLGKSGMG